MAANSKRASFLADLDRLRSVFETVDTEGLGYIRENELRRLARSVPGLAESTTPELMEKLDRDKDGKVGGESRIGAGGWFDTKCGGRSCVVVNAPTSPARSVPSEPMSSCDSEGVHVCSCIQGTLTMIYA